MFEGSLKYCISNRARTCPLFVAKWLLNKFPCVVNWILRKNDVINTFCLQVLCMYNVVYKTAANFVRSQYVKYYYHCIAPCYGQDLCNYQIVCHSHFYLCQGFAASKANKRINIDLSLCSGKGSKPSCSHCLNQWLIYTFAGVNMC